MYVLVLNYEFPPLGGGASPQSYEICKELAALGHRIDVVTMGFKGLRKQEVVDGFTVYRVSCLRRKKEICTTLEMLTYVITAVLKALALVRKNRYDICHAHFIVPTGLFIISAISSNEYPSMSFRITGIL